MIRVRRPQARDLAAGLGEHGGVAAVRVRNPADARKMPVQQHVRRRIRRGAQVAFEHAAIQVDNDHIRRPQPLVRHAAGLDHHALAIGADPADVAPGQRHQPARSQIHVGLADSVFQVFEHDCATFTLSRAERGCGS
jgi:hypothetical protein